MTERCPRCDLPLWSDGGDWNLSQPSGTCEGDEMCCGPSIDWRRRALAAEAVVEAARNLDESLFAHRELRRLRSDDPQRWEKYDRLARAIDEQEERTHLMRQALDAHDAERSKR